MDSITKNLCLYMILIIPFSDKEVGFLFLPSLIPVLHMLSFPRPGTEPKPGDQQGMRQTEAIHTLMELTSSQRRQTVSAQWAKGITQFDFVLGRKEAGM